MDRLRDRVAVLGIRFLFAYGAACDQTKKWMKQWKGEGEMGPAFMELMALEWMPT